MEEGKHKDNGGQYYQGRSTILPGKQLNGG